jgi:hypothetical protein
MRTMNYIAPISIALALGSLGACTGAKDAITDDFSDLSGLDEKADAFSGKMKIVGSLDYNTVSAPIAYTSKPRYRVFKFAGNEGDKVDVWVRSNDGDAVAWILDSNFKTLAMNDDADDTTTDAHVTAVLPKSASATHYLAFRDFYLAPATFTVSLNGGWAVKFCEVDADCVRVSATCCSLGQWDSAAAGEEDAFRASLSCPAHQICPAIYVLDNHSMPECDLDTHQCAAVKPADIACGGFSRNPHACPENFDCVSNGQPADVPGACRQECDAKDGSGCAFGTTCHTDGLCYAQ